MHMRSRALQRGAGASEGGGGRELGLQVLSDPGKRKRYDEGGMEGLGDGDFMDGALFFTALFGSDRFQHLVGELAIATMARLARPSIALLAAAQVRHARLAPSLLPLPRISSSWLGSQRRQGQGSRRRSAHRR